MDAQVTTALISGGAALTVAVLGIGGAISAQLFTTRHAFENSLALQERQYAKQEHERHEQSQREDAYRFAEQRRSTYGRFVRLAREFLDAVAVAMITPGPVVITVGFIGYLVAGFPGACVAAAGTFLPCYLFTILPAPYFKKHGKRPGIVAFVDGVTAAAILSLIHI